MSDVVIAVYCGFCGGVSRRIRSITLLRLLVIQHVRPTVTGFQLISNFETYRFGPEPSCKKSTKFLAEVVKENVAKVSIVEAEPNR